jgi:putative transposase
LRDECLNLCALTSIEDVRQKLAAWRIGHNERRPHSSLGNLTQSRFVK